jgi:hypothetical protein
MEAWHMPMSSAWVMTTRSPSEKPSLLMNGLFTIARLFRYLMCEPSNPSEFKILPVYEGKNCGSHCLFVCSKSSSTPST